MNSSPHILVAPLNWGLGHASRSCAIIDALIREGATVIPAADGESRDFLKREYPQLRVEELPDMKIRYPEKGSLKLAMMGKWREFLRQINREQEATKRLIQRLHVDGIISDNRYGVFSESVPSVLVTHQIHPPVFLGAQMVKSLSDNFNEIWVPDQPGGQSLAGRLGEIPTDLQHKAKYLGWLSRMNPCTALPEPDRLMLLLSGPESRRTQWEELLLQQGSKLRHKITLIRGTKRMRPSALTPESWRVIDLADRQTLQSEMERAAMVVARAGYSSLMDLAVAGKSALIVPTPGQAEQEYLASLAHSNGFFKAGNQKTLKLAEALEQMEQYQPPQPAKGLMEPLIDQFLKRWH